MNQDLTTRAGEDQGGDGMKGKLLIEPGFEAGSLYCGNCCMVSHVRYGSPSCMWFVTTKKDYRALRFCSGKPKRCQQCRDAEVKEYSNESDHRPA